MDSDRLRAALTPKRGQTVLSREVLGPLAAELLGPAPGPGLAVHVPELSPDGPVRLRGVCSLLRVDDVPVLLTADDDGHGGTRLLVRFTLPRGWTFGTSFPDLPQTTDWDLSRPAPTSVPLDQFTVSGAEFVFASAPGPHPDRPGAQLVAGLNLVADLGPGGLLGEAVALLGLRQSATVPLYGRVRLDGAATARPLEPGQWPWQEQQEQQPVPGLDLRADLGLAATVRGARFDGIVLRAHTPLTRQWVESNPTYQPVVAWTGRFGLGEGGIEAEAVAPVHTGAPSSLLLVSFRSARLAGLTGLSPLLDKQDPHALLPDGLAKALGRIELQQVAVELSAEPGQEGVTWASATVGLPDLDWQVAGDLLTVTSLRATFESARTLRLSLTGQLDVGGVPLEAIAASDDGFTLYARSAAERPLDLTALVERYAPGVGVPSGLLVDTLAADVAPGRYYALALSMPDGHPWRLPVGPAGLSLHGLSLHLAKPHDGAATGSLSGRIALDRVGSIDFGYARPGPLLLRGFVPRARLSDLAAALVDGPVQLPRGFDLEFLDSTVLVGAEGEDYRFRLATRMTGLGALVLQVQRVGAHWGLAAGFDLKDERPQDDGPQDDEAESSEAQAAVPAAVGVAKQFQERFGLQELLLVLSTFDGADIRFPSLAVFDDPRLPASLPPLSQRLRAGLTAYARWRLSPTDHQQRLLATVVGEHADFGVALHLGTDPARDAELLADYRSTVAGQELHGSFGARLDDGRFSLFLDGTLPLRIQGHVQTLSLELRFLTTGALLSGSMTGTTAVTFAGFHLANLAVAIGLAVDGAPTLGVAATVAAPGLTSSLAVLFDSTASGHSMVAGSLGDLTLRQVAEAIAGVPLSDEAAAVLERVAVRGTKRFTVPGALATALDALDLTRAAPALRQGGVALEQPGNALLIIVEEGRRWQLTDRSGTGPRHSRLHRAGTGLRHYRLHRAGATGDIEVSLDAQLYVAPQAVRIGAAVYPSGYWVSGELELFGLRSRTEFSVDPAVGLSVESTMDRLVVGGEQILVIEGVQPGTGPSLSVSTVDRPGAQQRDAHATLNGRLLLFGMERSLRAEVKADSLSFGVTHEPLPGLRLELDLDCRLRDRTDLEVDGRLALAVGTLDLGVLGKVTVDSGLRGRLTVRVRDGKVEAVVSGTLTLAGRDVTWSRALSSGELDPQRLAVVVEEVVTERVRVALGSARAWIEAVGDGLVSGVNDFARVLTDWFGVTSVDEVAALLALVPGLGPLAVLDQLAAVGYDDRQRSGAMTDVYRWGAAVVDAADLAVTDAALRLGDLFGVERGKVKLVVFNRTGHLLVVTGVRGDEIRRGPDVVVLPGAAGVVGVFDDAGGRWGWLHLQDQTTGDEYQLYIERTRSSTQYAAFGYRDDRADAANGNPRPFADGAARAVWEQNSPTATYQLLRAPRGHGTAPDPQPGVLRVGQYLLPGERLSSPGNRYALRYGTDNLLVQLDSRGTVVWRSSGTPGAPGVCVLQRDGNLVIYDRYNKATWSTATRGPGNVLHVEDGGGVELRSASGARLWANRA